MAGGEEAFLLDRGWTELEALHPASHLPSDDALAHVFSYLPARDLCSVLRVSRHMRSVALRPHLWRDMRSRWEASGVLGGAGAGEGDEDDGSDDESDVEEELGALLQLANVLDPEENGGDVEDARHATPAALGAVFRRVMGERPGARDRANLANSPSLWLVFGPLIAAVWGFGMFDGDHQVASNVPVPLGGGGDGGFVAVVVFALVVVFVLFVVNLAYLIVYRAVAFAVPPLGGEDTIGSFLVGAAATCAMLVWWAGTAAATYRARVATHQERLRVLLRG